MKTLNIFLLNAFLINTSGAETIIRFNEFRFMHRGQDLTYKSDVGCHAVEGYGTLCALTFSGVACGIKASVPQQAGGVHIRDQHVDLLGGELTEQNGIVYMCSVTSPPQVQQVPQQQINGSNQ